VRKWLIEQPWLTLRARACEVVGSVFALVQPLKQLHTIEMALSFGLCDEVRQSLRQVLEPPIQQRDALIAE
jgi:hypothetical protein